MSEINFYLSQQKRSELPKDVFGFPEKRLFPILSEADVLSASRLLGRAKLTEKERKRVKSRIIRIALSKGYKIPEAWNPDNDPNIQTELSTGSKVTWITSTNTIGFGIVKKIDSNLAVIELCDNADGIFISNGLTFACDIDDIDEYTK